jgi:hypothetical protein
MIMMGDLERPSYPTGIRCRATTESAKRLSPGRSPPKKSGLGLVVGRNTSPCSSSTDIGAQTFAAPVCVTPRSDQLAAVGAAVSRKSGSNVQLSPPVRASEARTDPRCVRTLIVVDRGPHDHEWFVTTGGDVIWTSPGCNISGKGI